MFAADDIVANEIAPRPHITQGTTRWSLRHCVWYPHLGVLGAPLPAIHIHSIAVMLNVLGRHVGRFEKYVTENPKRHLHTCMVK